MRIYGNSSRDRPQPVTSLRRPGWGWKVDSSGPGHEPHTCLAFRANQSQSSAGSRVGRGCAVAAGEKDSQRWGAFRSCLCHRSRRIAGLCRLPGIVPGTRPSQLATHRLLLVAHCSILRRWRTMSRMPNFHFSRRSFLAMSAVLPWACRELGAPDEREGPVVEAAPHPEPVALLVEPDERHDHQPEVLGSDVAG